MRVCGVEIKSNEAIMCIMSLENGLYDIPQTRIHRLALAQGGDAKAIRNFQFTFAKLMADYHVEKVVIKGRATKGRFAGSAVGFKVEAAIELIEAIDVDVLASSELKKYLERSQVLIDFRDTGLKSIQKTAFETVFGYFENNK